MILSAKHQTSLNQSLGWY